MSDLVEKPRREPKAQQEDEEPSGWENVGIICSWNNTVEQKSAVLVIQSAEWKEG